MKQTCLLLLLAFFGFTSFAQSSIDYASIKMDKKEDFTEEVNKAALQASSLLLSLPLAKDNPQRVEAFQYLMRWMSGSPDYSFDIDETATNISKVNEDLLVVYLAAMSKYALENKEQANDKKVVKLNTVKMVLAYCHSQNVKLSGELKKLHKANEAGELEKYLKL